MKISIHNTQTDTLLSVSSVRTCIRKLCSFLEIKTDLLLVHFVSEEAIGKIHADFFSDPSPTDCITFPIDSLKSKAQPHVLGELFICPKVALTYAERHSLDPKEELTRYLIHGLLHLMGFKDTTTKGYREMKQLEEKYLLLLKEKKSLLKW